MYFEEKNNRKTKDKQASTSTQAELVLLISDNRLLVQKTINFSPLLENLFLGSRLGGFKQSCKGLKQKSLVAEQVDGE